MPGLMRQSARVKPAVLWREQEPRVLARRCVAVAQTLSKSGSERRICRGVIMLSRQAKQLFYELAGPVMKVNGWRHRVLSSASKGSDGKVKIQFGPGRKNYIEDWINVDANMFT